MLAEDPGLLCCARLDICEAKRALSEVAMLLDVSAAMRRPPQDGHEPRVLQDKGPR
jgi:hypothetical protein